MKICFVNSILYTPEKGIIQQRENVEDTMAYKLCDAFSKAGHEVTLIAAKDYKPLNNNEASSFKSVYLKSNIPTLFRPSLLPLHFSLYNEIKRGNYDLIISSEFFSINSLIVSLASSRNSFIWQELSSHNALFMRIPSIIWYNIIGKLIISKIIGRSDSAKEFISKYSSNVLPTIIEHGVLIDTSENITNRKDQFIVVSQLIRRKNIESIIYKFSRFYNNNPQFTLIIVGDGEMRPILMRLSEDLGISNSVKFIGFKSHQELLPIWRESKALLIDTHKDLNMVSVPESIACGTPIIMNEVPLSRHYISKYNLGIVKEGWDADEIQIVVDNNSELVANCLEYRKVLSVSHVVDQFITLYEDTLNK
ncbi:MAG: glycosyltransferase [Bacteroidales bacterium]